MKHQLTIWFHIMQLAIKVVSHFNGIVFTSDVRLIVLVCFILIISQSFHLHNDTRTIVQKLDTSNVLITHLDIYNIIYSATQKLEKNRSYTEGRLSLLLYHSYVRSTSLYMVSVKSLTDGSRPMCCKPTQMGLPNQLSANVDNKLAMNQSQRIR